MEFVGQNWREIPTPEEGRTRIWDDRMYQLGFQILSTGAVSWIVKWRVPSRANQVTKKVGVPGLMSPTQAREAAKSIMLNFTDEVEEEEATLTAKDLLEDYYDRYILRPGDGREYEQAESYRRGQRWSMDKYLTGDDCEFGKMRLQDIDEGTISTLLTEWVNGRVNQNRVQALVRSAYNWAKRQEDYLRIFNPVTGHRGNSETPLHDRLFDNGVRKLGKAWRTSTDPHKDVCLWPLLVGCRKSAAIKFGCGKLDAKERVIRFDPQVEMLKGCEIIYIPECALKLTKGLPKDISLESTSEEYETAKEAFKRAWNRLRKKANVNETSHDMRRTFCSFGIDLGFSSEIMNLVTHKASGAGKIADTYGCPADKTYRDIVDKVGSHLWKLLHEDPLPEGSPDR